MDASQECRYTQIEHTFEVFWNSEGITEVAGIPFNVETKSYDYSSTEDHSKVIYRDICPDFCPYGPTETCGSDVEFQVVCKEHGSSDPYIVPENYTIELRTEPYPYQNRIYGYAFTNDLTIVGI